jgi:hypothetical protein
VVDEPVARAFDPLFVSILVLSVRALVEIGGELLVSPGVTILAYI